MPTRRGPRRASGPSSFLDRPPAALRDRIDFVWAATPAGSRQPTLHEFFPDAGVHLVFRRSASGARAVLLGPATERATVEHAPGAEYLGVRFLAGQAPRLADVPSAALTDAHVDLGRLGALPIVEAAARLAREPDVAGRCRALAELACAERRPLVRDAASRQGARLLEDRRGHLRVEELARALRLGERTVERRFRAAFGMTPKRLARLVRLRHVLGALATGTYDTLAGLALDLGYADQAHLVRDYKLLTGHLPGAEDAARSREVSRPDTRVVHRVRA
jgi:AraC-like DNA-binding protein